VEERQGHRVAALVAAPLPEWIKKYERSEFSQGVNIWMTMMLSSLLLWHVSKLLYELYVQPLLLVKGGAWGWACTQAAAIVVIICKGCSWSSSLYVLKLQQLLLVKAELLIQL
jgi:hypothetical protein